MSAFTGKLPITVMIAAKNEEVNLRKCLQALKPAEKVILLDSHSTDRTDEIVREFGGEVVQFTYRGGYPKKRQWALDTLQVHSDWVFFIDADEVVPDALWHEIAEAFSTQGKKVAAYLITKGFHFMGRKFRYGGFSHSAVLLFQTGKARFEHLFDDPATFQDMEVHERLIVDGKVGTLNTPLIHEDFKGLAAYIDRHNKYSTWEAKVRYNFIKTGKYGENTVAPKFFGNAQERRRFLKKIAIIIPFEDKFWFLYHYVMRMGLLEGRRGLIACQIRASYIAQVRAKIFEYRIKGG